MKKINITIILFSLLLMISCDSRLDVLPEDNVASNTVFNSRATILGTVIGMYSKLQDGDQFGEPQMVADFMSDNVNFVGSFPSFNDINQYETLATNASIDDFWIDSYETINITNLIIERLPDVQLADLTDADKAQFIAEAQFVRALVFFELVNQFAQPYQFASGSNLGIPLPLQPFEGGSLTEFQLERSTVNDVHSRIEQDLQSAMTNLPDDNGVRASKGAAEALLARLYLYREDWSSAANAAHNVITSVQYALANSYDFYDTNFTSPEHIFAVVNTASDATVGNGFTTYYNAAPGGRGDAPFSQDLVDTFALTPADKRFTDLSVAAIDAGNNNAFFTTKYPDIVNAASLAPVLRITEMYLIRAEANQRAGTSVGDTPLNDINLLRNRAGLADLGAVDLAAILLERRKELCFEGHRRMDLLRNNFNLRPGGGSDSAPGADKVIFPIPDDETTNNPNITQNPGNF